MKKTIKKGHRIHIKTGLIWVKDIQINFDSNALEPWQVWVVCHIKRKGQGSWIRQGFDWRGFCALLEE